MSKEYGEFECPYCKLVFHRKKEYFGHIGGAHKRNITKDSTPVCKFCKKRLVEGQNWASWAIKQRNLICVPCKRKQNREVYIRRVRKTQELRESGFKKLKEKLENAKRKKARTQNTQVSD